MDGIDDGAVVGHRVGDPSMVGCLDGAIVGEMVGSADGVHDEALVGHCVGDPVVGALLEGAREGCPVGAIDGDTVGSANGDDVKVGYGVMDGTDESSGTA